MLDDSAKGFLRCVQANRAISQDDGIAVLELWQNSPFTGSFIEALSDAVNLKVSFDGSPLKCEKSKQTNLHIDRYLTQAIAKTFNNGAIAVDDRLQLMAKLMRACGMHNPNERTLAYATAVATRPEGLIVDELLSRTRRLKDFYGYIHQGLLLHGPDVYPSDPTELLESHPAVYAQMFGDDIPVPST